MTAIHDDFESYLHTCLTAQRDDLQYTEVCSLLDEQAELLEAELPDCKALTDYRQLLRSRTDYEVHWAYWRGYLDCVSLLKRLTVL